MTLVSIAVHFKGVSSTPILLYLNYLTEYNGGIRYSLYIRTVSMLKDERGDVKGVLSIFGIGREFGL